MTSAEALQELLPVYLPLGRLATLDAALEPATQGVEHILPIEAEAVLQASSPADRHPELTSRDLLHLAICQINQIREIKTFDRGLFNAFHKGKKRVSFIPVK